MFTSFKNKRIERQKEGLIYKVPLGDYDYDLIVVGCGSGGMRAAKEAAKLGQRVACLDFVKPSPRGTTWGIGGTCVNAGCVPDKLMHHAALTGETVRSAGAYGWNLGANTNHDWLKLQSSVHNYLQYLNSKFEEQLKKLNVKYINAFGEFTGKPHEIQATDKAGNVTTLTSRYFIIAVGSRPKFPDVPNIRENSVTSDDIFTLPYCPGKTVVLGASFVSLEIGGFIRSLGLDVTIITRSILLRGFDQQMAEVIGRYMTENTGIKFVRPAIPKTIEKIKDGAPGLYRVTMTTRNDEEYVDDFNTVLVAVGRVPSTRDIGLDKVGVQLTPQGYIVHVEEQTTCPYIYAVGDVLDDRPEMAPTAAQAGKLLAQRMFAGSTQKMYYQNVPTAVFTPLEYGCVGLSEEDAITHYGRDDIEVYHSFFQPLEWALPNHEENACYAKLVCVRSQKERVVGFHMAGPNAAEITQGFTIALNMHATKADFDKCVGIHPTCAEVFTLLELSKRSGMIGKKVGAEVKPCYTGYQQTLNQQSISHVPGIDDPLEEQAKLRY